MLKTELEVIAIGEPNISALTDSERHLFFETLYQRVLELAKEKKENQRIYLCIGGVATCYDNSNTNLFMYG